MVGPGKGIDTNYYFVVCGNILGGCKGTTGPSSVNPATGKPYGSAFPEITVSVIVDVQKLLLDSLGVKRLAAVAGGSLGGMQVLEWGIRYPEFVDRCICIASGVSLSAQALAFDLVARDAILSDPNWAGGDYYDRAEKPSWGLAHARKIGHITYLSPEIMEHKFGREKTADAGPGESGFQFQVGSYLDYQGRKLVERFDANSYIRIAQAMDSFDLLEEYGTLENAFKAARAKFLVVGLSSDWLFPPEQSRELANALLRAGKAISCCTLDAPYGHDAFLVDIKHLSNVIRAFLPWVGGKDSVRVSAVPAEKEFDILVKMIRPGSRVLDLGCGDGSLLSLLAGKRQVSGVGVDIDIGNVTSVLERGHDVFQADIDAGLAMIPDNAYDYAVLSETLQIVRHPRLVLREILRVAREGIVSFPNFGKLHNRLRLGLSGCMPEDESLPFKWYDTPEIHAFTLNDFRALCRDDGIRIVETVCIPDSALGALLVKLGLRSLGAHKVLARIAR
jgi:homoserine O-acetyltransferase